MVKSGNYWTCDLCAGCERAAAGHSTIKQRGRRCLKGGLTPLLRNTEARNESAGPPSSILVQEVFLISIMLLRDYHVNFLKTHRERSLRVLSRKFQN